MSVDVPKRKLLVTDGIAIPNGGDYSFSIVLKKECVIEDVINLLKCEKLKANDIVLVNVGSYNISASQCGWDHELIKGKNASELIEDIALQFKNSIDTIVKHATERDLKVVFCGLLPLPIEQDYDKVPKEKRQLADMLSRLFVKCDKIIVDQNEGKYRTLNLEKYCTISGSKKYASGQLKIKRSNYNQGVLIQKKKKHLSLVISDYIRKLR